MHIDTPAAALPTQEEAIAREAVAAERAVKAEAREANEKQIAELATDSDAGHQAEHIRGLVAATMGQISVHASDATREHAANWQQWALGIADTVSRTPGVSPSVHGA